MILADEKLTFKIKIEEYASLPCVEKLLMLPINVNI
jgi:hypothetical protein